MAGFIYVAMRRQRPFFDQVTAELDFALGADNIMRGKQGSFITQGINCVLPGGAHCGVERTN